MQKKVMLADDDPDVRRLLQATLEGDDRFHVLVASDGAEALDLARREQPDLLFLDVLMPRMDGVSVCRTLKEDPSTRGIAVIMLTALAQESDRRRAEEAGADGYFTKPFSPTALLQKVDEVLEGPGNLGSP